MIYDLNDNILNIGDFVVITEVTSYNKKHNLNNNIYSFIKSIYKQNDEKYLIFLDNAIYLKDETIIFRKLLLSIIRITPHDGILDKNNRILCSTLMKITDKKLIDSILLEKLIYQQ